MDFSKLNLLRQAEIQQPCPEEWNAMKGDDRQRFCAGCGCFVHNLAGMGAIEAEELLATPDRVCTRMTMDAKKGILTRDGWIPRLLLAGALAASAAGCTEMTGDRTVPPKPPETASANPEPTMGELTAPSEVMVGKIAVTPPKPNPPERPVIGELKKTNTPPK